MQNKKKSKPVTNKNAHKKKIQNQGKFRKAAPQNEASSKDRTEKQVHVRKNKSQITKVINKSIESQMLQRAAVGKQKLSILKS